MRYFGLVFFVVFLFVLFSKRGLDQGGALGGGERLFLTLVVTVLGEESCRDHRRKQKEEGGLWETAAHAERTQRIREQMGKEGKGVTDSFLGARGHCEEFAVAHKVLSCLKLS